MEKRWKTMKIAKWTAQIWQLFEIAFTIFFIGEIGVKMRVFGLKDFLMGADWYWRPGILDRPLTTLYNLIYVLIQYDIQL